MKRLICILLILLVFSGCTRIGEKFSLNRESLSTSFHSKISGNEYKGSFSFDENNNMFITITYPDEISGFSMYLCGDNITCSMKNVENTYKLSDFPDDFALIDFYKALRKAVTDGVFVKNSDSAYEMTCEDVTIVADEQGNITSASVKNGYFIFGR